MGRGGQQEKEICVRQKNKEGRTNIAGIQIHKKQNSAEVMEFWLDTVSDNLDLLHKMDDGLGCLLLPDRYDTRIYNRSHDPIIFAHGSNSENSHTRT